MSKNPFEKLADKLLHRKDKGDALKKYNIDLSGVLGEGINQEEIQYNEYKKLIGLSKTCLSGRLHFWLSKKTGDNTGRINDIQRDIKIAANIGDRINKKTYTSDDIIKLRSILSKHGCF